MTDTYGALFILPLRYKDYIPVLSVMEQDCYRDQDKLKERMKEFLPTVLEADLVEKLVKFVDGLYAMDQCVQDWDIDYTGWYEYDRVYTDDDEISQSEVDELNMRECMNVALMQLDILDKYTKYKKQYKGG